MARKVILYIAISLDGFIAKKDGSVAWLDEFNNSEEDYGYKEFYNSINTVIMGNTTYKQILGFGEFPYKDKNCYVFSKTNKGKNDYANYVNGNPKELLESFKGENIWLVGGANLTNQFLKQNLIDEFIITIIPKILGDGIKLFEEDNKERNLVMKEIKSYKSGIVQVHYSFPNKFHKHI